jgi:aspartate/methionine/tyrosine aminotransferase
MTEGHEIDKFLPLLAGRTDSFQESVIREMTRLGDESGAVNLSQGLPDFDPPQGVLEAAINAIREGENQYTFPFGLQAFRRAIAKKSFQYNHIEVDPEKEVTVTCGVSEGLMATILALTDPGDEAIIFEPWYENYLPDCVMAGVIPRFVSLHEPDYSIDMDELRAAFSTRTRLVLINTPHNPTGKVFTREELHGIAALCQEFNAVAVTDEIYERILYDGFQHISMGSLDGMQERTVTISGLGKTYAVTGWRVGWVMAEARLSGLIRKVHDYLTVCAPAPFQAAGIIALGLPETYYSQMMAQYEHWRAILLDAISTVGFDFHKPQGAYYVMADFSRIPWNPGKYEVENWTLDRKFAEFMAREIGVAVVPGSSFYTENKQGKTRVRFNFAKKEDTLREAARRLVRLKNA